MKLLKYISSFLVLILVLAATYCRNQKESAVAPTDLTDCLTGKAVKIYDGDTYDLLLPNDTVLRVRMEGIDAPEKGMPFNNVSKKYLGELLENQTVYLCVTGTDRYKRTLGFTYLEDGRDVGAEMIKAGLAWHYKAYNNDEKLAELEEAAKKACVGLWSDSEEPLAPWDVRKDRRKGKSK